VCLFKTEIKRRIRYGSNETSGLRKKWGERGGAGDTEELRRTREINALEKRSTKGRINSKLEVFDKVEMTDARRLRRKERGKDKCNDRLGGTVPRKRNN